jgi:hypothetical protein
MKIPYALQRAFDEFQRQYAEAQRNWSHASCGLRDAVYGFVAGFYDVGARAEHDLCRRAELVSSLAGPESRLSQRSHAAEHLINELCQINQLDKADHPSSFVFLDKERAFPPRRPTNAATDVADSYAWAFHVQLMQNALKSFIRHLENDRVPLAARAAAESIGALRTELQGYVAECRRIVSQANGVEADGCRVLRSLYEELRPRNDTREVYWTTMIEVGGMFETWFESLVDAASSLLAWLEAQPAALALLSPER